LEAVLVSIGVHLGDGLVQVPLVDRMVLLERRPRFMSRDRYDPNVVYAGPSPVRHEGVATIMSHHP